MRIAILWFTLVLVTNLLSCASPPQFVRIQQKNRSLVYGRSVAVQDSSIVVQSETEGRQHHKTLPVSQVVSVAIVTHDPDPGPRMIGLIAGALAGAWIGSSLVEDKNKDEGHFLVESPIVDPSQVLKATIVTGLAGAVGGYLGYYLVDYFTVERRIYDLNVPGQLDSLRVQYPLRQ